MKLSEVIVLSIFLIIFKSALGDDMYCKSGLCPRGKKHVACGKDLNKYGPSCPKDAAVVTFSATQIANILELHNKARSLIASGKVTGFPPAVQLLELQWDKELATLAEYNVRTCKNGHDECRNTVKYKTAGQNIASISSYKKYPDTDTSIKRAIMKMWFEDETKVATKADIEKFPCPASNKRVIGHFTQLVNDKTTNIGCAAVRYADKDFGNLLFVCNYSYTNICSAPVYGPGKACSKCRTGCNRQYQGLCGPKETIQPYSSRKRLYFY